MTHPIIRLLLLSLLAFVPPCFPANAQEPPAEKPSELLTAFFRVPEGMIFRTPSATNSALPAFVDSNEMSIPAEGVNRIDKSIFYNNPDVYDVSELFKNIGLTPNEKAEAYFLKKDGVLFIRNTKENIELLEVFVGGGGCWYPMSLRTEVFLVEFPSLGRPISEPSPSYSELRAAAGKSWKQTAIFQTLSKTGERAVAETASATLAPFDVPQENDIARLALENVLGPDYHTIDSTYSIRYEHRNENNSVRRFSVEGGGGFEHGKPQVIQYLSEKGEILDHALIMRISVCLPDGRPAELEVPEIPAE